MDSRSSVTVASLIANFLVRRNVRRIFGLQGGHIQPIWDCLAQLGIAIVDVRDEGAAVHMAHAHAELTGELGVALVTAGPGVTNTVTAMANASVARVPVLLIGGAPPRPQDGMGPLQGIAHAGILQGVTRYAVTARVADQLPRELDLAVARAFGDGGEPGPVYLEIPTDVVRASIANEVVLGEHLAPKSARTFFPDPAMVRAATDLLWKARRPLVITGRGAKGAGAALVRLLDALGAAYLDTQESRGLVPADHTANVGALRARAMSEADVVVLVGRKLDYQLGYGSPVAFPNARFVRISDVADELIDNRRGAVEIFATPAPALDAIVADARARVPATDRVWTNELNSENCERANRYREKMRTAPAGRDGAMHPNRLLAAIGDNYDPASTIVVADGGDILSFARPALSGAMSLDSGAFGCLGVGIPYAIAAKLAYPSYAVVAVIGDGAFGFNAMELDTAVRHRVPIVVALANNAAWNIERYDQLTNYDGRIVGTELAYSDYAALARALGAYGERVTDHDSLPGAIARARGSGLPAVLDVVVSRDAVSSDATKGLALVPDFQALTEWDAGERRRRGST